MKDLKVIVDGKEVKNITSIQYEDKKKDPFGEYVKRIEVIDAEICAGTCEVCECEPRQTYEVPEEDKKGGDLSELNKMITFEASFYHDAENTVAAYYIGSKDRSSWSNRAWFSKKHCVFIFDEVRNVFTIQAPVWYLKLLKINIEKLTLIK